MITWYWEGSDFAAMVLVIGGLRCRHQCHCQKGLYSLLVNNLRVILLGLSESQLVRISQLDNLFPSSTSTSIEMKIIQT